MHLRRSFVTVLIAVPLLASCGFSAATDLPNTNAAGTNDRSGSVSVLAATVVSSGPDEGTFIANLSNNDQTQGAIFTTLEGGASADPITVAAFAQVPIPPGGYVNLADGAGVKLTGSFVAGNVIPLVIGFEDGETISLDVPVVRACAQYAGLDPAASPSPSGTPTVQASPPESTGGQIYSCDLSGSGSEQ